MFPHGLLIHPYFHKGYNLARTTNQSWHLSFVTVKQAQLQCLNPAVEYIGQAMAAETEREDVEVSVSFYELYKVGAEGVTADCTRFPTGYHWIFWITENA